MTRPREHSFNLADWFEYREGAIYWISGIRSGKRAGTVKKDGYRDIRLCGRGIKEHRIIYEMCFGSIPGGSLIDHLNGDKLDNRPENLRLVDALGNTRNNAISTSNTSGVAGVSWDRSIGKWRAQIGVNNRQKFIGNFEEFDKAVAARKTAEKLHGFHPNHGRAA